MSLWFSKRVGKSIFFGIVSVCCRFRVDWKSSPWCITVKFSIFMLLMTVTFGACCPPFALTLTVKIYSPFYMRRSWITPSLKFPMSGGVLPTNVPFFKLILFSWVDSGRTLDTGRRTFFDLESGLKTLTFFVYLCRFRSRCDDCFI